MRGVDGPDAPVLYLCVDALSGTGWLDLLRFFRHMSANLLYLILWVLMICVLENDLKFWHFLLGTDARVRLILLELLANEIQQAVFILDQLLLVHSPSLVQVVLQLLDRGFGPGLRRMGSGGFSVEHFPANEADFGTE